MKIILIAPSGGGKSTVSEFIIRDFGVSHISTGDIFRRNIADGTPLGEQVEKYIKKGLFVPDEIVLEMVGERIVQSDCQNGFILDGFPRTLNQAQLFAEKVDIDAVIELDVSDEIVMYRLTGRWMCRKCGTIHNSNRESIEHCKLCDSVQLYQRDDDKEDIIKNRLAQYREVRDDLLNFYRSTGKLFTVSVDKDTSPEEVYQTVKTFLDEKGIK